MTEERKQLIKETLEVLIRDHAHYGKDHEVFECEPLINFIRAIRGGKG